MYKVLTGDKKIGEMPETITEHQAKEAAIKASMRRYNVSREKVRVDVEGNTLNISINERKPAPTI